MSESKSFAHLPAVCYRQWRTEHDLRRRGIDFRTTDPEAARIAYAAMTEAEFVAINGRQAWANRRTIARSLRGLLVDRPMRAVDLGCGVGASTGVLVELLPAGSRTLGIEFAAPLVEVARRRPYPGPDGQPAAVEFAAGSITETFRDAAGEPLPENSVDLVNASGIFGHHLSVPDATRSLGEISRILKPGGIAALDPGPRLGRAAMRPLLALLGFEIVRETRSNPFDRTGQIVARLRDDFAEGLEV